MTALPGRRRVPMGRAVVGAAVVTGVLGLLIALSRILPGAPAGPAAPLVPVPTVAFAVEARGQVVPIQYARLSPLTAGRVSRVLVAEGTEARERQELVRFESGLDVFSLLAPFAGTVTAVSVRPGESVLAGTVSVTIADLSRFQIETTDLDEFSVARVQRGQIAAIVVDALGETSIAGRVASVPLMAQQGVAGDSTYPVRIDVDLTDPRARWGMTARVRFEQP